MRILITGINGYIGTLISQNLREEGHEVEGIRRNFLYSGGKGLERVIKNSDVIINLAGATILQRWRKENRKFIHNSRVLTTRKLVNAIGRIEKEERPKQFISISAVGIYNDSIEFHKEDSKALDEGFLGHVVSDWEAEVLKVPQGINTTIFRLGIVLGKEAKILSHLLPIYKLGLGGKIGHGQQAFPFIHETDVVNAIHWAIVQNKKSEIYNLAAPESVNDKEFSDELAIRLNKRALLIIPAFAFKLVYGRASRVILRSPSVNISKLVDAGFKFTYPDIKSTLKEILES